MNLGMETETLEFKKSTGELKEAINSIVAILNKHHRGDLYFGVKSDGTPVGQIVTEQSLRDISHQIFEVIQPRIYPKIQKVLLDGKECIHVHFEGSEVPYFAYGIAKIRTADEDITLSPQELTRYIQTNAMDDFRWEKQLSDRSISQADESLLVKFVTQAQQAGRLAFDYSDKKTVLNQLELTSGETLLNAGKVLFADDPIQDIQMAIFAGRERLTFLDIQREHGPILNLIDLAEAYIKRNIRWKVEFDGSLARKEVPEVPIEAIREAIVNSFCHKTYSTGQSNEIAIYSDRIEIYNPGRFPEGHSPEDYIENNERPIRRNPLIARTLYLSRQIENFGTGLRRIADACRKAGNQFEFKNLKDGFLAVFYRDPSLVDEETTKETAKTTKETGKTTKEKRNTTKEIVKLLVANPRITVEEMSNLLGLTCDGVRYHIKKLRKSGIIERKGSTKKPVWVVKKTE